MLVLVAQLLKGFVSKVIIDQDENPQFFVASIDLESMEVTITGWLCLLCTVHGRGAGEEETTRDGDEVRDSGGGGSRGEGGPSLLPRPRRVHGRDLQLREHPDHPHLLLPVQAQAAKLQQSAREQLWVHGDHDDGEPQHGHHELLLLRAQVSVHKEKIRHGG